ncbi:MAG: hypothetical protein KY475_23255, partial [Planctomycetes bacterium]|nr:hypothetical protein [Planctomycetota bacterium]
MSPWYAPDGGDRDTRMQAAQILADLPDLALLHRRTEQALESLRQPATSRHRWIGWLALDRQGSWRCMAPRAIEVDGDLLVVRQPAGASTASLGQVGEIKGGEVTWRNDSAELFLEGRP